MEKTKAQAKLHHAVAVRNKAKFEEKDREMLNEVEKNLFCPRSPTTPRALEE